MKSVFYTLTNDLFAPAVVHAGGCSTPVWRQNRWESGPYAVYIRKNGCGHCCTAMAARLHGVDLTPAAEYEHCRNIWGAPKEVGNPRQDHYMSVCGISKVLSGLGIPAVCFGVPKTGVSEARLQILQALSAGKQVIFWSHPSPENPDNPFSAGEHYVLAAGITETGKILIANSSERAAPCGVQLVDADTVAAALYLGSCPADTTWGEPEHMENCAGFVIVG